MDIYRAKPLALVGIILLNIPIQLHAAQWRSPSLMPINSTSQKLMVCGGLTAFVLGATAYIYRYSKQCIKTKKNLLLQKKDLPGILQSYPNCSIKQAREMADLKCLEGMPYTDFLKYHIHNSLYGSRQFILFQNNIPIGHIKYSKLSNDTAHIDHIGIRISHQRKGFGNLLMCYVIRLIERQGFKKITLYAADQKDTRDDLIKFYTKLGFNRINEQCSNFEYTVPKQ